MPVELKVPEVGESITEAQITEWLKSKGERVERDEPVVVLETDKATLELPAPVSGTITEVVKEAGEAVEVGEVIGYMKEDESGTSGDKEKKEETNTKAEKDKADAGKREQVEKRHEQARDQESKDQEDITEKTETETSAPATNRHEELVPMSPMRLRIAERLVEAKQQSALLTTFNEIDMSRVIELRGTLQERFLERYEVKLGFMSFFVKAVVEALKDFPQLNAEVRGTNLAYRHYYDIGIAVGGGKGLVVPVLRNVERMSFGEIEVAIADFAQRARANDLKLDELQGGTFTISNGGVYGSLLSTPIVNPPQSGILGLHAIQERPVARGGEIVIRPMMYVAVTYDHRIVDGREAVTFLRRIKETIEEPSRILIEA